MFCDNESKRDDEMIDAEIFLVSQKSGLDTYILYIAPKVQQTLGIEENEYSLN